MGKTTARETMEHAGKAAGYTLRQIGAMLNAYKLSDDDTFWVKHDKLNRRWYVMGYYNMPTDIRRSEKMALAACKQHNLTSVFIKEIARKKIDAAVSEIDAMGDARKKHSWDIASELFNAGYSDPDDADTRDKALALIQEYGLNLKVADVIESMWEEIES